MRDLFMHEKDGNQVSYLKVMAVWGWRGFVETPQQQSHQKRDGRCRLVGQEIFISQRLPDKSPNSDRVPGSYTQPHFLPRESELGFTYMIIY